MSDARLPEYPTTPAAAKTSVRNFPPSARRETADLDAISLRAVDGPDFDRQSRRSYELAPGRHPSGHPSGEWAVSIPSRRAGPAHTHPPLGKVWEDAKGRPGK